MTNHTGHIPKGAWLQFNGDGRFPELRLKGYWKRHHTRRLKRAQAKQDLLGQ